MRYFFRIVQFIQDILDKFQAGTKIDKAVNSSLSLSKSKIENSLCGIGQSKIKGDEILIFTYPFEPSVVYPNKAIKASEIKAICVDFGVCKIYVADDIIFVSAEKKEALKKFAEHYKVQLTAISWNWDWILEPYLDMEFTKENEQLVLNRLEENGIGQLEVDQLRAEVGKQMYTYNFDTMLWDWCSLGLADVLSAMRAKYNANEFRDFYKRAIEIDKRIKR